MHMNTLATAVRHQCLQSVQPLGASIRARQGHHRAQRTLNRDELRVLEIPAGETGHRHRRVRSPKLYGRRRPPGDPKAGFESVSSR